MFVPAVSKCRMRIGPVLARVGSSMREPPVESCIIAFMGKSFTLVQLRYFSVVAKLENMTAAALAVNVTQSTLSSAIGQLEREMGLSCSPGCPAEGCG